MTGPEAMKAVACQARDKRWNSSMWHDVPMERFNYNPDFEYRYLYAAPASQDPTREIIAWLDAEIEDAKQKQVAGFKLCTAQGALMGEKSHSRQCALFEVKQRLVAPIREDRNIEDDK